MNMSSFNHFFKMKGQINKQHTNPKINTITMIFKKDFTCLFTLLSLIYRISARIQLPLAFS